jgi:Mce-associated membrane protein
MPARPRGLGGPVVTADDTDDANEPHNDPLDLAEAAAEEAEAVAAAARARARAIRLRRVATAAQADEAAPEPEDAEPPPTPRPSRRRRWLRRPRLSELAAGIAFVVLIGLFGISVFFLWHHRDVVDGRQRAAQRASEFSAAASKDVATFMSLDFNHAQESVQRALDISTGEFRDQFQKSADGVVNTLQESKVTSQTKVNAAAVQSMTDNSAVVLVAATTNVSNAASAQQAPRRWRLTVTVTRDNGQLKMSKLEFGL